MTMPERFKRADGTVDYVGWARHMRLAMVMPPSLDDRIGDDA